MNDKYIIGVDPYNDNKESKVTIFKNGELIDLRTKDEINFEKNLKYMDNKNNPKELEYWRNIFPNKSDEELEEYRSKWSKENPKYLKFDRL
jgi:hypothetical protein